MPARFEHAFGVTLLPGNSFVVLALLVITVLALSSLTSTEALSQELEVIIEARCSLFHLAKSSEGRLSSPLW